MRMSDVRDESMAELDFTAQIARVPRKRHDEPIVESVCPVCKTPTKRENALCARCRVAA